MKKFLIGLSILGLTNLAYPNSGECNNLDGGSHIPPANKGYLKLAQQGVSATRILGLQKTAAEFDIIKSGLFMPEAGTYEITFEKDRGTIQATYDNQGNIRQTLENFDDVSLPATVRNSIWRDYKGCYIKKNTYQLSYSVGKVAKAVYKVWIVKDGTRKKLKFNAEGQIV